MLSYCCFTLSLKRINLFLSKKQKSYSRTICRKNKCFKSCCC